MRAPTRPGTGPTSLSSSSHCAVSRRCACTCTTAASRAGRVTCCSTRPTGSSTARASRWPSARRAASHIYRVRLNINQLVEGTKGVAQGAAGRGVQLAKGTKDVAQGAARGAARGVDGAARGAARGVGGAARGAAQNVKSATTGLSSR
eukprot:scaffold135449_cov130-Phaeocystis_antarctica.AAC.1